MCLISFRIAHSPNGWTDGELAARWIVDDFDRQTREKAAGETRVLLLDGHNSHHSLDLLTFSRQNNIDILGYPPKCTHALQGLDVVCFARMKEAWKEEICHFEELHRTAVKKGNFTGVFGRAFLKAFTTNMILAAFSATGIYPFNADVITGRQMKPSLLTSTQAAFPLPQPSPVRRVMAAFHHHHTHSSADASSGAVTPTLGLDPGSASAPKTPPPIPDSLIDPALFTPSKRGGLLTTALAGSSSGSFLVADAKLTSDQRIAPPVLEHTQGLPMPNWSLLEKKDEYQTCDDMQKQIEELTDSLRHAQIQVQAQNSIIEGAHAQLVVQDLYLGRLNDSLNVHEKKKATDRTRIFPDGQGRLLTSDQFQEELAKAAETTQAKAAAQEKAKAKRQAKKAIQQAVDDLWKSRAEEHKQALQAWEAECAELRAAGILKKNLPKRPVRMTKAQIRQEIEGSSDEGSSEDDENEVSSDDD